MALGGESNNEQRRKAGVEHAGRKDISARYRAGIVGQLFLVGEAVQWG
jgi:hypothetical protein